MKKKARIIAFYLPQYHPIPENDNWWGKGFTEWTLVAKAKPRFKNHYQPKIPSELGFYDLRLEQSQIDQSNLAIEHGIDGFCYWHYWLGEGKRLLEKPFENVLESKKVKINFCLGWANHSWKGVFFGAKNKTLVTQKYPGTEDHVKHYNLVSKAFKDNRYLRVNDKVIFFIYRPKDIPNCLEFTQLWRKLAQKDGLNGIHFIGEGIKFEEKEQYGLDAVSYSNHREIEYKGIKNKYVKGILSKISENRTDKIFEYREAIKFFLKEGDIRPLEYPSIIPGWDTTARLGKNALILKNNTPELFKIHVQEALAKSTNINPDENIIFLKSWNEWSEGNYVEPDTLHGRKFLEVIRNNVCYIDD